MTAFLLLFILAGLTDINTITPLLVSMIGLGVGIDYSLFIVTRFRQLLHEGLSPARRRRRGRRLGRPRGALRRPDGRDLGDRPRLLRPRLRHEARHRLRARRPDDGADRELAADRGAAAARPQDRPAEGAVPAPDRRLRGGPREDAHRPLGPVRDRTREDRVRRPAARRASCSRRRRRSCASAPPTRARSRRSRPRRRAYDLLAEGFGPGFNGPIPIVVDVNGDPRRRSGSTTASRASTASPRSASRSSTTRRPSRSSS